MFCDRCGACEISAKLHPTETESKNPKGRVPRAMPVGEWELAQRASSEARQVEIGATGSARRVSTSKPFGFKSE